LGAEPVFRPQGVPLQRSPCSPGDSPLFLCGRDGQADSDGSAVRTDVCRCETSGCAGSFRRLPADPVGQLVRAPADEKKTFETLGRLRQTWQSKPLRAISSTTCRT